MSTYRFILRDYHAIQDADIVIDGITVLSGVNGCGKSTLSRWLYYVIKGTAEFENNLLHEYVDKLTAWVDRMVFVCKDIERIRKTGIAFQDSARGKLYEIQEQLRGTGAYSRKQVDVARDLFLQALSIVTDTLEENLDEEMSEVRKERVMRYLNMKAEGKTIRQTITDFTEQASRWMDRLTTTLYNDMEQREVSTFFRMLDRQFGLREDWPSNIQLEEDGVGIIDGHLSNLYNLRNAIYVDTPMSVTSDFTNNRFWNALREMMTEENKSNESTEVKKLLLRIKKLLDGQAVLEKDDTSFRSPSLNYVSSDQQIHIRLTEVATGFKTFSYLQRLLENGYLNEETLLMIDEPEAHLHPQWIVEFARMLVLLHKVLGLKIMVASHNPDMVSAIHDIANKEGILDHTCFYVARQSDTNRHAFSYEALGHEIGEIFESFNIAIDRIREYGAAGVSE